MIAERVRNGLVSGLRERWSKRHSPEATTGRALQELAGKLTFSEDWPAANDRIKLFISDLQNKDAGYLLGILPEDRGRRIVDIIDEEYEPFHESTLEVTAALIARHNKVLLQVAPGLTNEQMLRMLSQAAHLEMDREYGDAEMEIEQFFLMSKQFRELTHANKFNYLIGVTKTLDDFWVTHFKMERQAPVNMRSRY